MNYNNTELKETTRECKMEYDLIYCGECKLVYYKMPANETCQNCHNELNPNDKISNLDILSCTTCHTIYSAQKKEEIIPLKRNEYNLCTCRYNCPPHSELHVGKEEAFIGNIILADLYECDNCGAIFFRNKDNWSTKCSECSSRLNPIDFDSEKQKAIYKCANPSHLIPLKIRSLILENNAIIQKEMTLIQEQEKELEKLYNRKMRELEVSEKKIKAKEKEKRKKQYYIEAKENRKKLFLKLTPKPLRCVVYKFGKANMVTRTNDGCNAIAHIKIRKDVVSYNQGTFIDRAPSESKPASIPEPKIVEEKKINASIPFSSPDFSALPKLESESKSSIISPSLLETKEGVENKGEKSIEPEIPTTELLPSPIVVQEERTEPLPKLPPQEEIFGKLPELKENQLYIKIVLMVSNKGDMKAEKEFIPVNYGVIPIEMDSDTDQYSLGQENLLSAYWFDAEIFQKMPLMFNNFTKSSKNSSQICLQKHPDGLALVPGENSINQTSVILDDQQENILITPTLIKTIQYALIRGYYSFDKESDEKYHNIQIKIYFSIK
jgi:hypothetical protein